MIVWYELIIIAIAVVAWFLYFIYLPLRRLPHLVQRIHRGERIHSSEIRGIASIRKAGKALASLSDTVADIRSSYAHTNQELDQLLASVDEGVSIIGMDGIIKVANHNFSRLFMLKEGLAGQRLRDLVRIFEVNEIVEQTLKYAEEQQDFLSYEVTVDDKLQTRSYRLSTTPILQEENQVSGCLLVVTDYSRIKEMESVERQMVASVSHELRTPLAVFKGYLEALTDLEKSGNEETQRIIQVLHRHSNRLNHLVEDLLILSRLQEKMFDLAWEPVSVKSFFKRIQEDAKHFLGSGMDIECSVEDGLETICMDAFRMEQVFHNLIDNAQRHSENSDLLKIGAKRDRESSTVHFYVQDQGRGIASDKLPLIFNCFYRVDRARSRARGGTGLGLTIVREIMWAHGGDAWAESNLGEGTTIWLSLPERSEACENTDP